MNDLRDRELEIVRLVATGASNKEIAGRLLISTNTVKVHLRNIFTKTGVSSRAELVMFAVNNGLVPNVGQLPAMPLSVGAEEDGVNYQASNTPDEGIPLPATRPGGQANTIRILTILIAALVVLLIVGLVLTFISRRTTENPSPTPAAVQAKWVDLAPISTPRYGLALVAYEDQLIAIGGTSEQGVTGAVERYDPLSDRWKPGLPKPVPVTDASAVVIAGKIYVPGGETAEGEATDLCEIYDPALDQWSLCPRLPAGRSAYGLTALDGSIYLFGGWDGRQVVDTVFRFRPGQDTWDELPRMPTARRGLGAAAAGRKILVVGGEDLDGPLPSNEIFYPDQSDNPRAAWSVGAPLPEPVSGMGVAGAADIIYVVGGLGDEPLKYPVMSFDDTRMWRVVEEFPGEIPAYHGLASLGKYLYLVGGKTGADFSERNSRYQVIYTVSFPIIIQ